MDRTLRIPNRSSRLGKPTWEAIDDYLPVQGEWTEREYLRFDTNRGIELSHGRLVFLPWPDAVHQTLLMICCDRLSHCYVDGTRGLSVPRFKLRLASQLWRMPDVVYVLPSNRHRAHSEYFDCADLVIEVVSPDRPKRDLVKKRREYAAAGIPEYWVVDPRDGQRTITVLSLSAGAKEYVEAGVHAEGASAASVILPGFVVDVGQLFAEATC